MKNLRTITFNGIEFSKKSKYVFSEFNPNECDTNRQEYTPLNKDGIIYGDMTYNARVVNIKGTILASCRQELFELMQKLNHKCNGKTVSDLIYDNGFKTYKAEAVADLPSYGAIKSNRAVTFNINFTLPKFFWFSNDEITLDVHTSSFDPRFTEYVEIGNSEIIRPLIYLTLDSPANVYFDIWNETSGKSFKFNINSTNFATGHVIIIDTEYGTAKRSNITLDYSNCISGFTDWYLEPFTTNKIKVDSNGNVAKCKMQMKFRYKYIGV